MSGPNIPAPEDTTSRKNSPTPKPSNNIISDPLQHADVLAAVMFSTPQDVEAANILQTMHNSGPSDPKEVSSVTRNDSPVDENVSAIATKDGSVFEGVPLRQHIVDTIVETVETTHIIAEGQEDVTDIESTVHETLAYPTTSRDIVTQGMTGISTVTTDKDINMKVDSESTISASPQPSPRATSANSTVSQTTTTSTSPTIHINNDDPERSTNNKNNEDKEPTPTPLPTDESLDAAEIHMHNTRILAFTALHSSPTYTPATLHHFTRDWTQQFCLDQKAAGGRKLFTCASHLWTSKPCETAQEYGAPSLARPGISHYFGHNKVNWLQVPCSYRVLICRKHYQSCSYNGRKKGVAAAAASAASAAGVGPESYVLLQVLLLKTQVARLGEWRADARFFVRLTAGMQVRVAAFHKFVSQGLERGEAAGMVDAKRISKGRDMKAEEKTPVLFAVEFDRRFGKENQSVADVLEVIGFIEEAIKGGEIEALPAVEFLLEVRKEDRLRLNEGNLRKAEREKEKLALPVELQAKKRGAKSVKAESDGDDDDEDQADEEPGSRKKIKATMPVKARLKRQRVIIQPARDIEATETTEETGDPKAKKAKLA